LIKKILLLISGILGCIFLIELTLSINNPFVPEEELAITLNTAPDFNFEFEPPQLKSRKEVLLLSDYAKDSMYSNQWLRAIYEQSPHATHIRLADISHPHDFWRNPSYIIDYIEKYPPSLLILQLSPSALNPILPVPNHFHLSDKNEIPLFQGEPELYKALYHIANYRNNADTFLSFKPFDFNPYSLDSVSTRPPSLLKKMEAEKKQVLKGISKISNACHRLGVRLVIIPQPILWREKAIDRYSRIPIDRLILWNDKPAAWYGASYFECIAYLEDNLPKGAYLIPAYRIFPSDSRFFSDGFRLNTEGQLFFAQQFAGRVPLLKTYRLVF
jgi:hypothetical protein